jgi:hypothetical protein
MAPVPQDVRGGQGGSQTQRINGAKHTTAKNGTIKVGGGEGAQFVLIWGLYKAPAKRTSTGFLELLVEIL